MREGEGVAERDDEMARLASMLVAVQARLDELVGVVAALDPDRVAQTRSIAEDGLARADHALAVAGDAVAGVESVAADALARADHSLARADDALARAEALGADGLARADHAAAVAGDAVARVEALGADALARADHAAAVAGDAVARAESLGTDALARADHAAAVAGDAVARTESFGADALSRADHALARADDALARAEALGADGLARADHAAAVAGDAVARVEALGADAQARADLAVARADDAVARVESLGADALARADHALERATDAVASAESLGTDALARADHAAAVAGDAVARAESQGADALARADHALARANDAIERANSAAAASEYAVQAVREALLPARIAAFAEWLELRPPDADVAVSIVLPTRDRPEWLPRAIASVLAQRYESWQLVVVDDGDTAAVEHVLAGVDDERVVTVEGPRRGLSAARNAGLDAATGDVVCYLDDDNVMHPAWLRAVAHVFAARDDVDVLYGVTIAEHRLPGTLAVDGWWPGFWQLPWSRETLLQENLTDAGALAHRGALPEARFDEKLSSGEDWDLLIRLTTDRPALAVPALAHAYRLEGDDRMSRAHGHRAELDDIRRRHAGD